MKRLVSVAGIGVLVCGIPLGAQTVAADSTVVPKDAPITMEQINAETDSAWAPIQALIRTVQYPNPRNSKNVYQYDQDARKMRDLGLAFWKKHPSDHRNLWWLQRTLGYNPLYLKDGEMSAAEYLKSGQIFPDTSITDMAAFRAWNDRYPQIRDSIMRRATETRFSLDLAEAKRRMQRLYDQHLIAKQPVDKQELASLKKDILELLVATKKSSIPTYGSTAAITALNISNVIDDDEERTAFAKAMVATGNTHAEFIGAGLERRIKLRKEPMEMKFVAFDGRNVDLAKIPAKIVLVDFWATTCSGCIADMPKLRKIYERFHDKGFEIIGVALDPEERRQTVASILEKNQVTWPQLFVGGNGSHEYKTKYGVRAVPLMLLLDENRKLIVDDDRGLEKRLETLLQ